MRRIHFMRICHEEDIDGKFSEHFGSAAEHISKETICAATDCYEHGLENSEDWNYPANHAIEEGEREALYDIAHALYRMDWMKSHGYTQTDVEKVRADYDDLYIQHEMIPDDDGFEQYFLDHGFDGGIFACRAEFLESEFLDAEYMHSLLGDEDGIFDLWKIAVGITCDWDQT